MALDINEGGGDSEVLEWKRKEARGEGEWRPSLGKWRFALTVGVGVGEWGGAGVGEEVTRQRNEG